MDVAQNKEIIWRISNKNTFGFVGHFQLALKPLYYSSSFSFDLLPCSTIFYSKKYNMGRILNTHITMSTGPYLQVFFNQKPYAGTLSAIGTISPPPKIHSISHMTWKILKQNFLQNVDIN